MNASVRLVAMVLTLGLTPGAAEAVENSVHLVREGHLAHVEEHVGHSDDEPTGDEHGCNSVFHACACHVSASFVVQAEQTNQAAPRPELFPAAPLPGMTMVVRDGEHDDLLRPPIN